uniref:Uncharacterized protein n=1 Tax=Rhizophora mucronata TaxID=61149 RepID=A0A2P2Q5E7_RHIMU
MVFVETIAYWLQRSYLHQLTASQIVLVETFLE